MRTTKILIVEDDPIHAFIAETNLKDHSSTHWVDNGHDALNAIEIEKYDVILMDINLNDPAMDGIKTMRNIRFNLKHRNTKIIAVTAASDDREWFMKQGFDGHYMKPITKEELLEEIDKQYSNTYFIY